MNKDIDDAIGLSRHTLVMRSDIASYVSGCADLPSDVSDFFVSVESGVLFSLRFDDETALGFEIADNFRQSINQFYGLPAGNAEFKHFDRCFVLFRSTLDFESVWGIDLNAASFGKIFSCRMAMGEHPQHNAVVVANSLSEWLRFWMNNLNNAAGDWRKLTKEPQLAPLKDA